MSSCTLSILHTTTVRTAILVVLCILISPLCLAQLTLLKDIDQMRDAVGSGVDPRQMAELNGTLLFSGRSEKGYELWKSNGTQTALLKDIHPGTNSSGPILLTKSGSNVYFISDDGLHGPSLWKSDGTASGTVWVRALPEMISYNPVLVPSATYSPCIFVPGASALFFAVRKSPWLWDLWVSDGTTDGTVIMRSNFFDGELKADMLSVINNELVFLSTTAANGYELWKSNGTVAGTQLLKDIWPGTGSSYPNKFVHSGSTLFFIAATENHGAELWKTDGTEAGTQMVRDISLGTAHSNLTNLIDFNGTLLFAATDGTNSGQWKSDGTEAGTEFINNTSFANTPFVVGNKVFYFKANGVVFFNYELWVWDGTTQTSSYVRTFNETFGLPPSTMLEFNGAFYFVINDATTSSPGTLQIWRSDGTAAGTYAVTAFPPHSTFNRAPVSYLTKAGGAIYFCVSANADSGNELWKTDGVAGHVTQVTDAPSATYDGYNFGLAVTSNLLYFSAATQATGVEPWVSDGTAAGTNMLIDISPGGQTSSSSPSNFKVVNDVVFFTAASRLWKASGTTVTEIINGISPSNDNAMLDNTMYYAKNNGSGWQLWRSAFPFASGEMVKSILTGTAPAYNMGKFVKHQNNIFFSVSDYPKTILWKTNGTEATTLKVKEFGINGVVGDMFSSGNYVYFMSHSDTYGYELWRSDGTEAGTIMVKDIAPGTQDGMLRGVADVNGTFFFIANDGVHGAELWKTDGTEAGTGMLRDIFPGTQEAAISAIKSYGTLLYFAADDGVHGKELWISDGTEAGTKMLMDLNAGKYSSTPDNFLWHEGAVYFTAYDNTTRSLWKTTGTTCGTIPVTNNHDIIAGGDYKNIAVLNNSIFVEAWSSATGWELFKYDLMSDPVLDQSCKSSQVVSFQSIEDKTYGNAFVLTASASSGLPIEFITTTPETISINGSNVTILKAGSATIIAKQSGNKNVNAAQFERSFAIAKASQSITFPAVADKVYGNAPFVLNASSSSGLPPTYSSSDPTVASVISGTVTIHKPGIVTITASNAGNENYMAAADVTRTFNIAKAQQNILFSAPSPRKADAGSFSLTATTSAGLPVTFTALSPVISINQNTATPLSAGTAMVQASQAGNDFYLAASPVVHSFCINPLKPNLVAEPITDGYLITSDHSNDNPHKWYYNGTLISGETSSTLAVTTDGAYAAKVSVDDCTSEQSEVVDIIITGIENFPDDKISFYPNPALATLTVEISAEDQQGTLEIVNSLGRRVFSRNISSRRTTVDISHLSPAIYLLRFTGGKRTLHRSLIVK